VIRGSLTPAFLQPVVAVLSSLSTGLTYVHSTSEYPAPISWLGRPGPAIVLHRWLSINTRRVTGALSRQLLFRAIGRGCLQPRNPNDGGTEDYRSPPLRRVSGDKKTSSNRQQITPNRRARKAQVSTTWEQGYRLDSTSLDAVFVLSTRTPEGTKKPGKENKTNPRGVKKDGMPTGTASIYTILKFANPRARALQAEQIRSLIRQSECTCAPHSSFRLQQRMMSVTGRTRT